MVVHEFRYKLCRASATVVHEKTTGQSEPSPVKFFGSSGYMVEGKRFNFPRWKRIAVLNLSRFLNPHAILLIR